MPKIKVHEKALAHLSRGLYRSPASALRELVSNAWDANATVVRINTNYPNFFQLSIEDNGDGITKNDFEMLMEGGIGNSGKRIKRRKLINDRPIIGRLGIGLLGIAQICGSFTVISNPKNDVGFRANIQLYDLIKEKLDEDDQELVKSTHIDVGNYNFEECDCTKLKKGTTIFSDDIHPTFVKSFQDSVNVSKFEKYREPPMNWEDAIEIISKVHSLQELGDYWRLLWELSASIPIQYVNEKALPHNLVKNEHNRLKNYGFSVYVDNIQLYKPIVLRNNPGGYTSKIIEEQQRKIYGRPMIFHGYLVVQEGCNLRPDELRGIMIRLKNVGIGYYDPSLLDYRYNEGPRSRWLTGEIYVDEGLEDALNIDRDSFNRFHPEFRCVQEFIHEMLRKKVFPDVYKNIDIRSKKKQEERTERRAEHFESIAKSNIGRNIVFKKEDKPVIVQDDKTIENIQKAELTKKKNYIEVKLPNPESLKTKKTNRDLASAIIGIFEISMQEKTTEKKREMFSKLLLDLLAKW